MNERIIILREATIKIAQMLTERGIEVTQRGVKAYVDYDGNGVPKRVNIPYIPDNATPELIEAIAGYLDHEVAHVLFSDFKLLKEGNKKGVGGTHNIIEDSFIERKMSSKFKGSASNLSATGKFFLTTFTDVELKKAINEEDVNRINGLLIVPAIRAWAGQQVYIDYMKGKWDYLKGMTDALGELVNDVAKCASTADTLDLSYKFKAAMNAAKEKQEKKNEEKKKDEGKKEEKGGDSGDAGKSDEEQERAQGEPNEKGEDSDGAADSGEDESAGDDKPQESEGESDKEKSASEDDEGDEPKGDEEGNDEPEGDESEGDSEPANDEGGVEKEGTASESAGEEPGDGADDKEDSELDSGGGNEAPDFGSMEKAAKAFDDLVAEGLTKGAVKMAESSEYLIYTTDWDVLAPLNVGECYHDGMLESLADDTNHMVGPLQKDLERAVAARSQSTWQPGQRSGRLHSANLSRLATGDGRVFRKKAEHTSKDVAVSLVVDCSGSMNGSPIITASRAAYALSSVLSRIGISNEVIGFTTGIVTKEQGEEMSKEQGVTSRAYTRMEPLNMPILKSFEEQLTGEVKKRFAWLPHDDDLMRNNIDGECIEVIGRRLLARRENGKVMIVLSDGEPNCFGDKNALRSHLKKVINDLERRGVNTIGLGIESDAVTSFYSKSIVVSKLADLPGQVMKELKHLLLDSAH